MDLETGPAILTKGVHPPRGAPSGDLLTCPLGRFAFPSEMGHSSTRAAYIYQHRRSLRDKMIAGEISRRAEAEYVRSGIQRARGNQGPS